MERLQRLQRAVEDVGEEQRVKDQAMVLAEHGREALQKKLARYQQLQTIAEELSNMTQLSAIAQLVVDRAFTLIGKSDVCLLFLVDAEEQELSLTASRKREAAIVVRAKHGDQFDRHVLRSHSPLMVNDARRDFRFTSAPALDREVASVIACPLMLEQTPAGLLRLDSAQAGVYTQDDLRFLGILLDLAATAVTNARLFMRTQQLAVTDGLTGVMLRRPLLELLERELTRSDRSREPVGVLIADVDRFKPYNDRFGHMAGDVVLKDVAALLQMLAPSGAAVGRYGGEEFVMLAPGMERRRMAEVAHRVREAVARQFRHAGPHEGAQRPPAPMDGAQEGGHGEAASAVEAVADTPGGRPEGITVSIGVASSPEDAQGAVELLRVADERLYRAKRDGRNRVCAD
jgi:diguanylate cyclase (GGDEF)-like protein